MTLFAILKAALIEFSMSFKKETTSRARFPKNDWENRGPVQKQIHTSGIHAIRWMNLRFQSVESSKEIGFTSQQGQFDDSTLLDRETLPTKKANRVVRFFA